MQMKHKPTAPPTIAPIWPESRAAAVVEMPSTVVVLAAAGAVGGGRGGGDDGGGGGRAAEAVGSKVADGRRVGGATRHKVE